MNRHLGKGYVVVLAVALFVLSASAAAGACGRCNVPCSWTWSHSGCCSTSYVYPTTSYCYYGYSPCYSYCYRPYSSCCSCYRPYGCCYYHYFTCYRSTCGCYSRCP